MTQLKVSAADSAIVLIDHAIGFANLFRSHTLAENINNTVALAKAARVFGVPLIVTNGHDDTPSGPLYPRLREVVDDRELVERGGSFDAFAEAPFAAAVEATGRRQLVMAGLMTEGCLLQTALTAVERGYQVFAVLDASAGETTEGHQTAVRRMIQAGVVPTTWLSIASEYQRGWSNHETVAGFAALISEHAPALALQRAYFERNLTTVR